jgi:hypothetical protein
MRRLASELVASFAVIGWAGTALATDDAIARWQGAWVLRDADYPGSVQAWNVHGDGVTVYDGATKTTEEEALFAVSPCRVARTRALDDGTSVTTFGTFAFAGDKLYVARTPATGGLRRGGTIVACVDADVYEYDITNGQCRRRDTTTQRPAAYANTDCAVVREGAATTFVVRPLQGGDTVAIPFYGDALLSQELMAHPAEHFPSFAAAIRRVTR